MPCTCTQIVQNMLKSEWLIIRNGKGSNIILAKFTSCYTSSQEWQNGPGGDFPKLGDETVSQEVSLKIISQPLELRFPPSVEMWLSSNPHWYKFWLNADAPWNIAFMYVSPATFHLEMSWLKEFAPLKMVAMLSMRETSQELMSTLKFVAPQTSYSIVCTQDIPRRNICIKNAARESMCQVWHSRYVPWG